MRGAVVRDGAVPRCTLPQPLSSLRELGAARRFRARFVGTRNLGRSQPWMSDERCHDDSCGQQKRDAGSRPGATRTRAAGRFGRSGTSHAESRDCHERANTRWGPVGKRSRPLCGSQGCWRSRRVCTDSITLRPGVRAHRCPCAPASTSRRRRTGGLLSGLGAVHTAVDCGEAGSEGEQIARAW